MRTPSRTSRSLVLGLSLAASTAVAGPALSPNSQPYRVANPPAATGRAGNATLAARALQNKGGTTDVDVTTGVLDSAATAPGNITKLQIKTYNGNADVQWTKNFNSLTSGGRLHYTFNDLHRGQSIQLQANIDKIDKRTDVVTVTGDVKNRPDLSASTLVAPDRAVVGSHVDISAAIQELNGDIGANADCRLFVDGTQVDQSLGIYVDAGGGVSCAFNVQFNVVGSHALRVVVDNVVPGDWDTANNSAAGTINIIDNTNPPVSYYASAWTQAGSHRWHNEDHYRAADGTYGRDWSNDGEQSGGWGGSYLSGWSSVPAAFPLQSVDVTLTSGENSSTSSMTNAQSWTWGDSSYGGGCDVRGADGSYWWWGYSYAQLCSEHWDGVGYSSMFQQRYFGDVTYHSQGYDHWWSFGWYTYDYSWNDNGASTYGQPFVSGAQLQIAATWQDADGRLFAPVATIDMQPWTNTWDSPLACWQYVWDWGSEEQCSSSTGSYSGRNGYTSGSTL